MATLYSAVQAITSSAIEPVFPNASQPLDGADRLRIWIGQACCTYSLSCYKTSSLPQDFPRKHSKS